MIRLIIPILLSMSVSAQTGFTIESMTAIGIGHGNAYLPDARNGHTLFIPSLISDSNSYEMHVSSVIWLDDVSMIDGLIRYPVLGQPMHFFARQYTIGGIELRSAATLDPDAVIENYFSMWGIGTTLPVWGSFRLGANLKWIREKNYIFAADHQLIDLSLSAHYQTLSGYLSVLNMGLSGDDLDGQITDFTRTIASGVMVEFDPIRMSAEYHHFDALPDEWMVTGAYTPINGLDVFVAWQPMAESRHISAGIAVTYAGITLAYGYGAHQTLNDFNGIQIRLLR